MTGNQIPITFVMDVRGSATANKVFRNIKGQFISQAQAEAQGQKARKQMFREHDKGYSKMHASAITANADSKFALTNYRLEGKEIAVLRARKEANVRTMQIEVEVHSQLIKAVGEEAFMAGNYTEKLELQIRKRTMLTMKINENVQATRAQRQALMQASISMFVMNISIGQAVGTYSELLGLSEEYNEEMREAALVMQAILSPLQVMSSFMMIKAATATSMLATVTLGLTGAIMGTYFAYKAVHAESSKARAMYSVMAGLTWALTAAHIALALAKWAVTAAELGVISASSAGLLTPQTIAAIALGAGAVVGIASYAMGSFQTLPGQYYNVTQTGKAEIHKGEIIGRPDMGGLTIQIYGNVQGDGYTWGQEAARALRDEGLASSEGLGGF